MYVATASSVEYVSTYFLHLLLPNNMRLFNWEVMEFQYSEDDGCDLIIGMDIITQGDFAITHLDGNTLFSFRMPSAHSIDYEQQQP